MTHSVPFTQDKLPGKTLIGSVKGTIGVVLLWTSHGASWLGWRGFWCGDGGVVSACGDTWGPGASPWGLLESRNNYILIYLDDVIPPRTCACACACARARDVGTCCRILVFMFSSHSSHFSKTREKKMRVCTMWNYIGCYDVVIWY